MKLKKKFPLFKKDSNPNKILIDIQAAAILQLYKEGIKKNQINLNRICTYSNPKLFNSLEEIKLIQGNGVVYIHNHRYNIFYN